MEIYSELADWFSRQDGTIKDHKHLFKSGKAQKQNTAKAAQGMFSTNAFLIC